MAETPKPVKTIVAWVTLGLVVAGGGFTAAEYFGHYASAGELRSLSAKQDAQHEEFQKHVLDESIERASLRQAVQDMHDDIKSALEQIREIARGTGSRVLSMPKHGDDE